MQRYRKNSKVEIGNEKEETKDAWMNEDRKTSSRNGTESRKTVNRLQ